MLEKFPKIRLGWIDVKQPKGFAHQRDVCASGEFHTLGCFLHAEDLSEGAFKRLNARAAAADERSIDIKEYEFNHAPEKLLIENAATSVFFRSKAAAERAAQNRGSVMRDDSNFLAR